MCNDGYVNYWGECQDSCPAGTYYSESSGPIIYYDKAADSNATVGTSTDTGSGDGTDSSAAVDDLGITSSVSSTDSSTSEGGASSASSDKMATSMYYPPYYYN